MEQSIHAKDSDVGKLALKNSTLKAQVAMAESQLKQKDEQGDALHPIDFEQLKIEHEQYVRKIEEKNAELLRLKRATGNVVEQLSKTKRKLSDTIKRGTWLRDQMIFKRQLSATFDEALKRAAVEHAAARRTNKLLNTTASSDENPAVTDYLHAKRAATEWEKKAGDYERKLEVAEMETMRAGMSRKLSLR